MIEKSNYDKRPSVKISDSTGDLALGWEEICGALKANSSARRIAIECYPGVDVASLQNQFEMTFAPAMILESAQALLSSESLEAKFAPMLGNDPVFARMEFHTLGEFLDPEKLGNMQRRIERASGRVVTIGPGATLCMPRWDLLIYADITRWEIQQRQRRGEIPNLGLNNAGAPPTALYKRAFFLDWRVADRHKDELYKQVNYWIDGNVPNRPAMLRGEQFRLALETVSQRPFRVVPFFDPGPWGGQWMRREFDLAQGPANYAWCFDCVPEENSLVLRFGEREFELPALTLVHHYPLQLLGSNVVEKFGAEFPIRFDFLDTMEGGNLSLQVHPLRSYIEEQFGLTYTQDESYYILDAASDATVYLGLRERIDPTKLAEELRTAQRGDAAFPAEQYVNRWPARKHAHFLIPAGTIHCSGRNAVVLEISATPYIFTFKLWDWGRLGLDGRPRPVHLEHGLKNIQWDRTTNWVQEHLIDQEIRIAEGKGWCEERTGLHPLEFIETRRHWFDSAVEHHTRGNLNVLNLVEGATAMVESPTDAFPPMAIHYAETFIVPAAVGPYVIRPAHPVQHPLATIKAYVREEK